MAAGCGKVLAAGVIVLGTALQAHAATISLTPDSGPVLFGNHTSQAGIDAALASYFSGYPMEIEALYKSDRECKTTGCLGDDDLDLSFHSSYETTFFNPDLADADARISYTSGPFISASPVFALVKDGRSSPAWYLFDITGGWDGKDTIEFSEFFAGGADRISQVSLYGATASVPDGGSMAMLLGIALLGLAGVRRMMP